jgi:type 1 fimbriae regulatory protein FimB
MSAWTWARRWGEHLTKSAFCKKYRSQKLEMTRVSMRSPAGDELRAIKRYIAIRADALPWLFISSERAQPLTRQTVNYLVAEAAGRAGFPPVHPHMLRHSCGFALPTAATTCA